MYLFVHEKTKPIETFKRFNCYANIFCPRHSCEIKYESIFEAPFT